MADQTQPKRQREEEEENYVEEDYEDPKRQKTYNHILSILEEDEDELNQDLSDIFTTLQQELSCESTNNYHNPLPCAEAAASEVELDHHHGGGGGGGGGGGSSATSECSPRSSKDDEDDDERVKVMRHLLEASDDELGLPNRVNGGDDEIINGGDISFPLNDGLWELEDETANYYAMLEAELFM